MGALSTVHAPKLGAAAIKGALDKIGLDPSEVEEVLMGHVVQAGAGQAPARQAAIYAGIPDTVPCTTVNKVCASGMKAIMQKRFLKRLLAWLVMTSAVAALPAGDDGIPVLGADDPVYAEELSDGRITLIDG